MSYILDALKKSSEERRRRQQSEELHDPLLLEPVIEQKTTGHRRLPLLGIILAAVLIAFGWQFFMPTDRYPGSTSPPTQTSRALPEQTTEPEAINSQQLKDTAALQQPGPKRSVGADQEDAPETTPTLKSQEIDNAPRLLEELPQAIRAQLPEMKYSGHVFSPNPQLRMILINTTVVREGDLINDDTRLLEITRDGLVMSYRDTDFRVVLF